jgi:peptide/nickel transport system permease protein
LIDQYFHYMAGLPQGKLGTSLLFPNDSIMGLIEQYLPWTVFTCTIAIVVSWIIGVVLGTIAAYRRGGWLDSIMTPGSSVLSSVPNFLVGTVLLFVFAVVLPWFPSQGAWNPVTTPGVNLPFLLSVLHHATLPIASYVIAAFAGYLLLMKSNTVSVLNSDFIAGARSHGIPESRIMLGYVAPNAIMPMVTNVVLSLAAHFGGSVLVETIFTYPGIGYLFGQAALNSDYSLLQALFGLLAMIIIFGNFVADILYTRLDPRLTLEDVA